MWIPADSPGTAANSDRQQVWKKEKRFVKFFYLTNRFSFAMIGRVNAMDRILEQTLLYDFYGELLTEHQKQVYEDVVFGDLTLSEAAEAHHISRQGVHDLIRRCDRALRDYEEKLGLVRKFEETKRLVGQIYQLAQEYESSGDGTLVRRIAEISREIGEL